MDVIYERLHFKIYYFHFSKYRNDSIVTEKINYDLLKKAKKVQEGLLPCNELIGCFTNSKTSEDIPPAIAKQHEPKAPNGN